MDRVKYGLCEKTILQLSLMDRKGHFSKRKLAHHESSQTFHDLGRDRHTTALRHRPKARPEPRFPFVFALKISWKLSG
ncbi:hypothetical protein L6452_04474 [Arctium lappa]|uniref:Uncharacterized protein n=1 Tax=Arctium lappa TaxID=4217 RepID=A0ACB9EET0_ARCLA|nr:hypothetical protein L6452_04474 [Arctium lappa]